MYYTNIKDYEQILKQRKDDHLESIIALVIMIGLVTALLI